MLRMADPDSYGSITPPMSPVSHLVDFNIPEEGDINTKPLHMQEDVDNPVCFICQGLPNPRHPTSTHPDSVLQKGVLESLLTREMVNSVKEDTVGGRLEWFGFSFCSATDPLGNMHTHFMMLKQEILNFEREVSTSCDFLGRRKNIRKFFIYLKEYITRGGEDDGRLEESFYRELLREIHGLALYIGRLADLPGHVLASASSHHQSNSVSHQFFHLQLDLHWSILELLQVVTTAVKTGFHVPIQLCAGDGDISPDIFHQVATLLIWDVVVLSASIYEKMSVVEWQHVDPFPCSCVKELIILLIHLLEHRQTKLARQSFWVSVNPILQYVLDPVAEEEEDMDIDSTLFPLPPVYECSDRIGFCWWLITNLALLYKYNATGVLTNKTGLPHNYHIVQTLMKSTLQMGSMSEGVMRCYLRSVLTLSQVWETNTPLLTLLWDHFYKKLNNQFQLSAGSLAGFASVRMTGASILELCSKRYMNEEDSLNSETSYGLFLRILGRHLQQAGPTGGTTAWRQMKGRFFIKFHSRRMLELTEVGINNFNGLFLTLAAVTDLEDVASKMVELLSGLDCAQLDVNRRQAVWRGMFALTMLYIERNINATHITTKLASSLHSISRELSQQHVSVDTGHSVELWSLVIVFMDSTQDVIESSPTLTSGEHHLIESSGIGELLKCAGENELCRMLSVLQAVLTKHRSVYRRQRSDLGNTTLIQHKNLTDALWQHAYPFVRSHACTLTPPSIIADLAAGFCLLALDMPSSVLKEDILHIFQYFSSNDQVNASMSCRFLCHLLPNSSVMDRLSSAMSDPNPFLISSWLRCVWKVVPPSNQMQELSRLMMKLPEMVELLSDMTGTEDTGYDMLAVKFVKALGKHYATLMDLQSKISFQTRVKTLLGDVPRHIAGVLKCCQPPQLLRVTYTLAGHMVKHCHNFLYNKSRPDCLLPLLVDRLVLPRSVIMPGKSAPQAALVSAIREHLDLFVQGLGSLDYRRDPYVQRKIKDIISHHLTRFPVKSSNISSQAITVHPFIKALSPSCGRTPSAEAVLFRKYFIDLLVAEYLIPRGPISPHSAIVFSLMIELCNKTMNKAQVARDAESLLKTSLAIQVLSDNPALRQQGALLTQNLVEANKRHPDKCSAAQILEDFVSQHLKIFQSRALKVIENIAVLDPDLVVKVIPTMTQGIRDSETKRGVGIDKQLRLTYCNLLQHLGPAGEEEKSALLRQSTS